MTAAAPIAELMAPSLRMKSRIAAPFLHPPIGEGVAFVETTVTEGGAASAMVFPLPLLLVLLDSGLVGAEAASSFFESITMDMEGTLLKAVTCVYIYIEDAQKKVETFN
ncbi:hypothetical protein V8G54_026371 [Vigna mungo]|uniref:Uncharacterized protein n=1 Tax=Vigna mungo TaxID=3915 RepID=A0AAQ3RN51_VIGMU